jgi:hypothetical protein
MKVLESNKNENKMNIKKSVACVYTNNEQVEKEIRKTIPFTIVPPKM